MYVVFCLIILITENYNGRLNQRIHVAIGFTFVCFLTLLASRMAIIAFICSAVYLVVKKMQERKKGKIILIISCCFILGIFLWLNPVARFRVIEEPRMTNYQADRTVTNWNSVSFRLLEWEGGWSVISANWFSGVGTGGWKLAMDNFYAHYNNSTIGLEHNAHNEYLQTWMENGLLGLFTFSACLWAGLLRLYKNSSYVSFILIFSLMCLTESVGERQKGVVFFTLFQVLFLGFEKRME
jgi:O-antigen ligase